MCCFFMALVVLGPRAGILIWWLVQPARWNAAFTSFIWPLLGFIFLPWTTLMFVLVAPLGMSSLAGFDWIWLGLGLFADIASYSGSAYKRNQIPGYPSGASSM